MAPDIDESLAKEAVHAIQIGVRWLEQNQQRPGGLADKIGARWPGQRDEDVGHWSDPSFPAMTGLAVSAILRGQRVLGGGMYSPAASRGLRFIISCVQEDGGIYRHVEGLKGGGLPNYNTAICVLALADGGGSEQTPMVREARAFLGRGQHSGEDVFAGGMGYDADTNREYADVANTYFALEALRRTEPGGEKQRRSDVDWEAAAQFLSRCQHLGDFNDAAWVRDTPDEAGGFAYNPVSTKVEVAGEELGPDTFLPAYGSATYAGISSYLNAGLDPDSPQVEAALEWCARHWTLDENPRLGEQSLYYYYLAMAKALDAAGCDALSTPRGEVKWRPALVRKLVALQRMESETGLGYWQNDNNRWWENDPNLATSYALLALETAAFRQDDAQREAAE
jgi:squalene-hopene/tetraprenyl-beta-curcumene cyclase